MSFFLRFFKLTLLLSFIFIFGCSSQKSVKDPSQKEKQEEAQDEMVNEKLNQALAEAKKMINEGRFTDAENKLQVILKDYPQSLEGKLLLANLFYEKRDYKQSVSLYEQIIEQGEEKAEVFFKVGEGYSQTKNYFNALSNYKKAIHLDPMLTEAYLKVGDIYLEWRDTDEASRWYERAIKTEEKSAKVFYHWAKMNYEMVHYDKALEQLEQVFEIDEMHLEGRILELKILQNTNKSDILNTKAKIFVQDFPNNFDGHLFLGKLFLDLKQTKISYSHYEKALTLAPQNPSSQNGMGNYYFDLKNYPKAQEFYSKALSLNPNFANAMYNLGLVKWRLKNYKEAQQYFTKAYQENKWFKNALLFSAVCSFHLGKEEEALKTLATFYQKDAHLYTSYLRNQEYAITMGQILQSFWNYYNRNSNFDRGFFVCLVDSRDQAITLLEPEKTGLAYFLLSRIYLLNQNPQKAKELFLKYVKIGEIDKESLLLDSTFNDFKTQEWFLKSLEK